MMELSVFYDKLNKVNGKVYVIEEEIQMPASGNYEAELQHDNIVDSTLAVYTGPTLTGEQIQTYALSTPSLMPWKRIIRIQTDKKVVYVSYETDGDTVEAQDINIVQDAILATQGGVNAEESRAKSAEVELSRDLQVETDRATGEEQRLDIRVDTEAGRAQDAENALSFRLDVETERAEAAEQKNADAIVAEVERAASAEKNLADNLTGEISRAKAAEKVNADNITVEKNRAVAREGELQGSIDAHITAVTGEVQALKAADTTLNEKKANASDVNRELADRYTKSQTFTKEEVLQKIEDLIGTAPDTLDTFKEIADALGNDPHFATTIMNLLAGKVDKETGKQLTSNDYSDSEKAIVADVNAKKHSHNNKSVLDKLTQSLLDAWNAAYTHISDTVKHITAAERTNWDDAYSKRHTHTNKGVIDKLTQAMLDKLSGIAAGAEVNVQPDWNTTDTSSDAYIKNKPSSMPASDVKAWAKADKKPGYEWSEIESRPSTFPPSTHNHVKSQITDMPTRLSQFTNDAGYITGSDVDTSQNHTHPNKIVIDKVTQAMLDKLEGIEAEANKYVHLTTPGNKHIPAGGTNGQILKWSADGTAVWGAPEAGYTHPNSGVTAGTYRSVTVNVQGHVTGGSNPTTLAGYGITDAAAKAHNHDTVYLKKGATTWNDLGGS